MKPPRQTRVETRLAAVLAADVARLEVLAEPGVICLSRVVHDQARYKLDHAFEDLGVPKFAPFLGNTAHGELRFSDCASR